MISLATAPVLAIQYRVVFDVLGQPYPWGPPIFGLGLTAIGGGWLIIVRWWSKPDRRKKMFLNVLLVTSIAFGLLWSGGIFIVTRRAYDRAWNTHRTGRDRVIEGVITSVAPTAGSKAEKVVVNGVVFSVSDYSIHPGYNVTTRRRGVLRSGAHVRLHYWDGRIFEIEIGK